VRLPQCDIGKFGFNPSEGLYLFSPLPSAGRGNSFNGMSKMRLHSTMTFYALLALAAAGLSLVGCNETPTVIGSDYLPQDVEFRTLSFDASDMTITSGIAAISNSSGSNVATILTGRADDSAMAYGMMALTRTDSLLHGSNPKTVQTAQLRIRPLSYLYGDTTSRQTAFDVVVLDEAFTLTTQWSDDLASRIESAPTLGTYTGTLPDSGYISVDLNVDATRAFLKDYYRIEQAGGDSAARVVTLKSIALRPHADVKRVASFYAATSLIADSLRPSLNLGLGDTTLAISFGVSNWISRSAAAFGDGKIVLAGGAPIRTLLKFSIDSIPETAVIHQATLTFHIDPAKSRWGNSSTPHYFIGYIGDALTGSASTYLTSAQGVFGVSRPALDSVNFSDIVRIQSIAPTISRWLRHERDSALGTPNHGIIIALDRGIIAGNPETNTIDYVTLFGPDAADPALRPTLTIMYSRQKNNEK
jgi:hypothetical protein